MEAVAQPLIAPIGLEGYLRVASTGKTKRWALVAFGAETKRPTIVCIGEDALPKTTSSDWVILGRDSDFVQGPCPDPATKRRRRNAD